MFCQRMCGRKVEPSRRLCRQCRERTELREAQRYDSRVRQESALSPSVCKSHFPLSLSASQ
jgi:hypothetical protein